MLVLLNPTGGLVGGDCLRTEVSAGDGAHCCLTTPSATKVYRTAGTPAIQEFFARLGPGAVLEYVPDHLIPFPGAALRQSVTVELGEGSRAILFDALAIGRVARGEVWCFAELDTTVVVTDRLGPRLRDRFRLIPARRTWSGLGGMEGMNYLATLALLFDGDGRSVSAELEAALADFSGVRGAVSELGRGGVLVRFLTAGAPELQAAFHRLWAIARGALLGLSPLDLRKG